MASHYRAAPPFELLSRITSFTTGDKRTAHTLPLVSRGFYSASIENLYFTVNGNALTTLAQNGSIFSDCKHPAACVQEVLIEGKFDPDVVSKHFAMGLKNIVELASKQRPLRSFKFSSPCLALPLAFETVSTDDFPGFISVSLRAGCRAREETHWFNIIVSLIHTTFATTYILLQNKFCTVNTIKFELDFSGIEGTVTFNMLANIFQLLHSNAPHLQSIKFNLSAPHVEGEHGSLQDALNDNSLTFAHLNEFTIEDAPLSIDHFLRRHPTVTTLMFMPGWQIYNDPTALSSNDVVPHLHSFTGTGNIVAAACNSHRPLSFLFIRDHRPAPTEMAVLLEGMRHTPTLQVLKLMLNWESGYDVQELRSLVTACHQLTSLECCVQFTGENERLIQDIYRATVLKAPHLTYLCMHIGEDVQEYANVMKYHRAAIESVHKTRVERHRLVVEIYARYYGKQRLLSMECDV
ncbi:hypothetical protein C8J55DRAFT_554487 [Lentinula edodes]|uniref:Uncharacterized protein n=1 Tax=Lentinula lateritia TaxID=40482 RepID=A0A9W9E0L5_9AGAR|nr:hypothetical protein C8J55DRAFT_554487 [Lentinula edodes]